MIPIVSSKSIAESGRIISEAVKSVVGAPEIPTPVELTDVATYGAHLPNVEVGGKMQKVKVLGVVGSPRKNGNTAKLVSKALEAAMSVPGVETELYEMAGKKIHHCVGCLKCLKTGDCAFQDDFQDFMSRYLEADGIIMGTPVYHMSVTGLMKSALDRLGNVIICRSLCQGKEEPIWSKVCGAIAVGYARFGGQELALSLLIM